MNTSDIVYLLCFWLITLKWSYDSGYRNAENNNTIKRIKELWLKQKDEVK
jgi:hypothetical protein